MIEGLKSKGVPNGVYIWVHGGMAVRGVCGREPSWRGGAAGVGRRKPASPQLRSARQ